jgi:hypothetical protein
MSSSAHAGERVHDFRFDITPEQNSLPLSEREFFIYAAGLFEGEGAVGIAKSKTAAGHPRYSLYVSVHMADREPMEAFAAKWGGGIYPSMRGEGRRPTFLWRLEHAAALPVLEAIEPFLLTERVRLKVQLGIAFQAQKAKKGGVGRRADAYRDQQRLFYDAMRALNQRGLDALSSDERHAVLAALSGEQA